MSTKIESVVSLLGGIDMNTTQTVFQSSSLDLVGMIHLPDGDGPFPAVVVCHPHPLYGGSMDNNVINIICNDLVRASCISFKFNFRGVGASQGSFSNGPGEMDDVRAAITFISKLKQVDPARLGLAGYSAGAAWGLTAVCRDDRIKALAAVSPPLSMFDFNCLYDCAKPKLMISGRLDNLIPEIPFLKFCQSLPEPIECYSVDGADHFWEGYTEAISHKITRFFNKHL